MGNNGDVARRKQPAPVRVVGIEGKTRAERSPGSTHGGDPTEGSDGLELGPGPGRCGLFQHAEAEHPGSALEGDGLSSRVRGGSGDARRVSLHAPPPRREQREELPHKPDGREAEHARWTQEEHKRSSVAEVRGHHLYHHRGRSRRGRDPGLVQFHRRACKTAERKLRKLKEKAVAKGVWNGHGVRQSKRDTLKSKYDYLEEESEEMSDMSEVAMEYMASEWDMDSFVESVDAQSMSQAEEDMKIYRKKEVDLIPMTVEDALESLQFLGHDFFMFLEKGSNEIKVVYKRDVAGYGVLTPVFPPKQQ